MAAAGSSQDKAVDTKVEDTEVGKDEMEYFYALKMEEKQQYWKKSEVQGAPSATAPQFTGTAKAIRDKEEEVENLKTLLKNLMDKNERLENRAKVLEGLRSWRRRLQRRWLAR